MKNLFLLLIFLIGSESIASELFTGTVKKSYGELYHLQGQTCNVRILQRDSDQIELEIEVGLFKEGFVATKNQLVGVEGLFYNYSFRSSLKDIPNHYQREVQWLVRISNKSRKFKLLRSAYDTQIGGVFNKTSSQFECVGN